MNLPRRSFAAYCAACALAFAARAQERYPAKAVTLVSPAAPGGLTDIVARVFAPFIGTALGQPVVVVNKTGAGGALGAASVAQSAPDGYTLLLGLGAMATLPEQEKLNGRKPPFTVDQLAPVASLTSESLIVVTHPDSALRSFAEVVAFARANPGKVSYSTTGPYGTYHVPLADFGHEAGVKMLAVPYGGGGPALLALLKKEVDISFVSRAVGLAQIRAGKLRPLLVWDEQRLSDLPDVPSLKDGGWKTRYRLWTGLFGPAGLPAPVLATLRDAVDTAMKNPALQQALARSGSDAAPMEGPAFEQFWQAETARLGEIVRRIGRVE
jgi:tripartite-type tricarboxylate transporter receptor subunit TctC